MPEYTLPLPPVLVQHPLFRHRNELLEAGVFAGEGRIGLGVIEVIAPELPQLVRSLVSAQAGFMLSDIGKPGPERILPPAQVAEVMTLNMRLYNFDTPGYKPDAWTIAQVMDQEKISLTKEALSAFEAITGNVLTTRMVDFYPLHVGWSLSVLEALISDLGNSAGLDWDLVWAGVADHHFYRPETRQGKAERVSDIGLIIAAVDCLVAHMCRQRTNCNTALQWIQHRILPRAEQMQVGGQFRGVMNAIAAYQNQIDALHR